MKDEDNIHQLPLRYQHKRRITGKQLWAQPEPPDEMVWEICANRCSSGNRWAEYGHCLHCPKWMTPEQTGDHEDTEPVMRGCYASAEHLCRVFYALQEEEFMKNGTGMK